MSDSFNESVTFKLDKQHFQECFEQSSAPTQTKDYQKANILFVIGSILFILSPAMWHASLFIVALAFVEFLSIRYKKAWWVWRQQLSKAANNSVSIRIDEHGITTTSQYVNQQILWCDIKSLKKTTKGILVSHQGGMSYLSDAHFSKEAIAYILQRELT
jgi:hypothetical protein